MTLQKLIDWIKQKKGTTDIGVVDSCETELIKKEDKEDEKDTKTS